MNDNAQKIHDKTVELLSTVGMKYLHPEAVELLKKHGIRMDGNVAYFTEDQLMKYVEMAPSKTHIYARDSQYDLYLGEGHTYLGPMMGGIKVVDLDGSTRPALVDDMIKSDKIVEANPRYHINGGGICTPTDVAADKFMVYELYLGLMLSSKVPPDVAGDYATMETCYDVLAAAFGCSKEELKDKPRMVAGMNVNAPLFVDVNMTETLFTNLKYGQPCYLAPADMAGSTSPVTTAGTIVQNNAEVLGTLALAQMYAPGAPIIYASQSTSADMRSLCIATGSPESALCYRYAGIMGDFYHLPVRCGGLMTDAKKFDTQAGYEPMLSFLACEQNGADIVLQGAGFLDAYLILSYEKMISDFQVVDYVDTYLKDIVIDEESIPLEDMQEVGHDGDFTTVDSTLANLHEAILDPIISVRGPEPADKLEQNAHRYIEKALASYKAPEIPQECIDEMNRVVSAYGISDELIAKAENARIN